VCIFCICFSCTCFLVCSVSVANKRTHKRTFAECGECSLPAQSSMLVDPGMVVPNRGHDLHDREPKFGWYLPFGHSSHLSPSTLPLYWPGLHGTTASHPRIHTSMNNALHALHDIEYHRSALKEILDTDTSVHGVLANEWGHKYNQPRRHTVGMPPPHGQRTDGRKSMVSLSRKSAKIWPRYDLWLLTSNL